MSLLEDIRAERAQTNNEVKSLARLVLIEMCTSVKERGTIRPVVAALVDGQAELHFPTWHTDSQQEAAFASISEGLADREAQGAVTAFNGSLTTTDGEAIDSAIIIVTQTYDWTVTTIYPYVSKKSGVAWKEPFTVDDAHSPLVDIFCAN